MWDVIFVALVLAYLLGGIPAGAWVARARGVDIQKVGSGNTGATNVLRTLGWGPGLAVALFDILKGALVVVLARQLFDEPVIWALCGLLAVLGHNFSAFLRLKGGKGVATSLGTLVAIDPVAGSAALVIGFVCIVLTRFVSAGSMVGATAGLVVVLVLGRPWWEVLIVAVLAGLLVWQHRDNIRRLSSGTERRFGEKAAS
ncbi:glycerol-3-phosphate 1-O-acyltransferase PlsY [Deinococcus pimensis]|uniref:glycerol-3-phosphate 1-O-acyltransferase PlsY n=1 Tax=Deinococcus pimensis TaxID=309888 RepID=UPI000484E3C2|nr:glycerol-3-phosphate 1-O-acyltransferase PlsY [Deinococcus pimensis]